MVTGSAGLTGVGRSGELLPDTGLGYASSPVRDVERKTLSNWMISNGRRDAKDGCAGVVWTRMIRAGSSVYFCSSLTYPASWQPTKNICLH